MPAPGEDLGDPSAHIPPQTRPRGAPGRGCTHHDGQEDVLELVAEAQGVGAEEGKVALQQLRRRQTVVRGERAPQPPRRDALLLQGCTQSVSRGRKRPFTDPSECTRPHPSSLPGAAPAHRAATSRAPSPPGSCWGPTLLVPQPSPSRAAAVPSPPSSKPSCAYHEGQRGEEEAGDELDVGTVVHHQLQPLEEGDGLIRLELRGLWGAEQISPSLDPLKRHPWVQRVQSLMPAAEHPAQAPAPLQHPTPRESGQYLQGPPCPHTGVPRPRGGERMAWLIRLA